MRKLKNEELERKSVSEFKNAKKIPVVFVLDNVRSLNNIGSVFRTADCFLIKSIYLCGITAKPPHREIQKTALGATESVLWKYFKTTEEAILSLKRENVQVFALEQATNSVDLSVFQPPLEGCALVLGHEVNGVSQEIVNQCKGCIEITQLGTKLSLNVSVAAGIAGWSLFHKLNK